MSGRKVIGTHAIKELLQQRPRSITKVFVRSDYEKVKDLREIHTLAARYTKDIEVVGNKRLDKEALGHQGAVVYSDEYPSCSLQDLTKKEKSLVILLDGVQDPHNIGAISRTAWLMGADAIYLPAKRSAFYSPSAHKVASGGLEHVALEQASQLHDVIKELQEIGFWVYALEEEGELSLFGAELPNKTALILGNEEAGIKKSNKKVADQALYIPQVTPEASFNVSVSAALAMAEYRRQHNFG